MRVGDVGVRAQGPDTNRVSGGKLAAKQSPACTKNGRSFVVCDCMWSGALGTGGLGRLYIDSLEGKLRKGEDSIRGTCRSTLLPQVC